MLHIPSASLYAVMSTCMVFANKFILNYWKFDYPISLISIEMSCTLITIYTLTKLGYLDVKLNAIEYIQNNSHKQYFFSAALFYALHSVSSLKALSRMNIAIYVIFKRCVPLVNLILSFYFFKTSNQLTCKDHKLRVNLSVILMTFGVLLAGIGDLAFDLSAYIYCSFSVICQALYFTSIQKSGESSVNSKNSLQVLFACSIISLPLLLSFSIITQEYVEVFERFSEDRNIAFYTSLIICVCCGCMLSFSQFWCTMNNNAITTSVIGVLKSMIQTAIGMFVLNDGNQIQFSFLTYLGVLVNLVFGTWYTYLKYVEKYLSTNNNHV